MIGTPFLIQDEYYLVFNLDFPSDKDFLEIDFNVTRTKYTVDPDTILSFCSLSVGQRGCTLEVPTTSSIGLVTMHATKSIAQSKSISVQTGCHPRIWVSVMIVGVFIVLYTLFVVSIVVCCYFCLCRKKANKYTPLSPLPASHPRPAPYNPSYGSVPSSPPEYY